jgi:hypothetical protein
MRSLSIATRLDHTTVAAHLRALREEPDPLIDLIENDRGLVTCISCGSPTRSQVGPAGSAGRPGSCTRCGRCSWELGHCAAFVYEALEQSRGRPQRSFDLTGATGLSRRAVYQALETLAAWHLVQPRNGRWTLVTGTSLQLLAEQFARTATRGGNPHRPAGTGTRRSPHRWVTPV